MNNFFQHIVQLSFAAAESDKCQNIDVNNNVPYIFLVIQLFFVVWIIRKILEYGNLKDGSRFFSNINELNKQDNVDAEKDGDTSQQDENEQSAVAENVTQNRPLEFSSFVKYSIFFSQIILPLNNEIKSMKFPTTSFIEQFITEKIQEKERSVAGYLSLPVLIGLLGTVVGIFFSLQNTQALSDGCIESFLPGIRTATLTTAAGLIATMFISSIFHKVKSNVDGAKHRFMAFVRTIDLPTDNELAVLVEKMSENLTDFNGKFNKNIEVFSKSVEKIGELGETQLELAKDLKEINLGTIVSQNLETINGVKEVVAKIDEVIQNTNTVIENIVKIQDLDVNKINKISKEFDDYIKNSATKSEKLIDEWTKQLGSTTTDFKNKFERINTITERTIERTQKTIEQNFEKYRKELEAKLALMKSVTDIAENKMNKVVEAAMVSLKQPVIDKMLKEFEEFASDNNLVQILQNISEIRKLITKISEEQSAEKSEEQKFNKTTEGL